MIEKLLRTLSLQRKGSHSWSKFFTRKVVAASLQFVEVCQHFYDN